MEQTSGFVMRSLVIRHHATADGASSTIENGTGQRASKKEAAVHGRMVGPPGGDVNPHDAALTARAAIVYSMI